jgi:hypothetical protein
MTAPKLAEPIVVAEFWANRRGESVRVQLRTFEGAVIVDVRKHYTGAEGKLLPTKKGVSLVVRRLPDLAAAITKALAKARELGLLTKRAQAKAKGPVRTGPFEDEADDDQPVEERRSQSEQRSRTMNWYPQRSVIDDFDVFDTSRALVDDGVDLDDRAAVERQIINPYEDDQTISKQFVDVCIATARRWRGH